MPNWIEGTMKLRGKREDIARFFREGLDASDRHKLEDQVKDDSGEDYLWFCFVNDPHIAGTRRAFIVDDCVEMYDDIGVACVDIKQAWAFDAGSETEDLKKWKNISEKYNVDIRLYGIECGMQFTQEIIIVRGRKPIVNEKQYENWDWDCPFPNMGG